MWSTVKPSLFLALAVLVASLIGCTWLFGSSSDTGENERKTCIHQYLMKKMKEACRPPNGSGMLGFSCTLTQTNPPSCVETENYRSRLNKCVQSDTTGTNTASCIQEQNNLYARPMIDGEAKDCLLIRWQDIENRYSQEAESSCNQTVP